MSIAAKADLILTGAQVITMQEPVEAQSLDLAVRQGRILALCGPGEVSGFRDDETLVIDCAGKTIIPGLIDSHNHMIQYGQNLESVNLCPGQVSSLVQVIDRFKQAAAQAPVGAWIKGWGYHESALAEKVHPAREVLDKACPDHPVYVYRSCMHVMAVNSRALKAAGITAQTPDPAGGRIGRGPDNEPNGMLYELGAMDLVTKQIPNPQADECARFLQRASAVYLSQGLTMVGEAGAGWTGNPQEASAFQILRQSKEPKPRVCMGLMESTYRLYPEDQGLGLFTGFGDDRLRLGPAKFVLDGSISGRTAAMTQAYQGTEEYGVLCEDPETLARRMERAHLAGFQIAVHAIGDQAIDTVLTAYETILSRHPRPHRHRIEHVSICRPDFIPRMKKLGIVLVVQPGFIPDFGDSIVDNLGPERISYTWPFKSLMAAGIILAGSSDRPVIEGSPWTGMWSAVHRLTSGGQEFAPHERLSPEQALRLYTTNGAYLNFMEDRLGSIAPGKYADLTVIDQNPLDMDPAGLKDVQVLQTFIAGQGVYTRDA